MFNAIFIHYSYLFQQAQLVGVPSTQQPQNVQQPVQQQVLSPAQLQHPPTPTLATVMSPPPPQQQQQQPQGQLVGQSGNTNVIIQHQNVVQQTQAQLSTKQQNIHATNPAINALFTSLIASANQFEQQQAAAAGEWR